MKYKAILFDFDYTLADSSCGIITCFQNVLQGHNYTVSDHTIKRTIGKTLEESFSILTGITDPEALASLKKEYGKQANMHMTVNTIIFPDAKATLETLKEKGLQLGIISTKFRFRIKEFLDLHFPDGFFDIIIGGEDVTLHKPDPQGLNMAISGLNLLPEDILYIGDSLIDAETAYRAGTDFVGVTTGVTVNEEFDTFPKVKIIPCLNELVGLLD